MFTPVTVTMLINSGLWKYDLRNYFEFNQNLKFILKYLLKKSPKILLIRIIYCLFITQ